MFYAQFMPSGNGMSGLGVAQVPTRPGPGGTLRPGWFSNLYTFDLLDNKTSQDIDATGSDPASLVTTFQYDPNQNLVRLVKPEGNLEEYDYDERGLRIAQRVGYVSPTEPGAVTIWIFDFRPEREPDRYNRPRRPDRQPRHGAYRDHRRRLPL
jgi:YD repeat-containing protein